jgi:hypothetical protein
MFKVPELNVKPGTLNLVRTCTQRVLNAAQIQ